MARSGDGEEPRVGGAEGRTVCTGQEWQEMVLGVKEDFGGAGHLLPQGV